MRKTISQVRASVREGGVMLAWYKATSAFQANGAAAFSRFRIFRRCEDGFVFGQDYGEFFSGMTPEGSEEIFDGELTASNDRKFVFVDWSVEAGGTYVYFVQADEGPAVGPVPVRVRDAQVWWTHATLQDRIHALAAASPSLVQVKTCGYTSAGREIFRVDVGHGPQTLGLVGLIHAGEAGPELIVPALERLVASQPALFSRVQVVAIPSVNADAREEGALGTPWYLRTTPSGVDLNRNFPADWDETEYGYGLDSSDSDSSTFRGFSPACAPETQAVMQAFTQARPNAVFAFHCLAGICGMPALAARKGAPDPVYADRCRRLAQGYAEGLYPETPFDERWLRFGTSAGSLPTWLYNLGGIPAFDLEGQRDGGEGPCITDQTDRALIAEYQERHARAIAAVMSLLQ